MPLLIEHYVTPRGVDVFQRWVDSLSDIRCRIAVLRRIDRLAAGNAGDHRFCRDGVWELRVDCGPGYRVYFARPGEKHMLLLGGGSKRTQVADIAASLTNWRQFKAQS